MKIIGYIIITFGFLAGTLACVVNKEEIYWGYFICSDPKTMKKAQFTDLKTIILLLVILVLGIFLVVFEFWIWDFTQHNLLQK